MEDVKVIINMIGNIREIRTSPNGDYDWTSNCWTANSFLIISEDGKQYRFDTECDYDKGISWWKITILDGYSKEDFPYRLKRFSDNPLRIKSYERFADQCDDIHLDYEDVELVICSEMGDDSLFSVQDWVLEHERSRYLNYTDEYSYVETIAIEFDKEPMQE